VPVSIGAEQRWPDNESTDSAPELPGEATLPILPPVVFPFLVLCPSASLHSARLSESPTQRLSSSAEALIEAAPGISTATAVLLALRPARDGQTEIEPHSARRN